MNNQPQIANEMGSGISSLAHGCTSAASSPWPSFDEDRPGYRTRVTNLKAEQGGPLSGYDPVVLSEHEAEAERGEGQLGWGRTREAQGGARCLTLGAVAAHVLNKPH